MANLRRYPQVAQADNMTPEDAVMMQQLFQPPPQEGDPNAVMDPNALVDSNGIPQSMSPDKPANPLSPVEQYLQQLNSPEYKAQLAELQKQSQAALEQQRQGVQQNEQLVNQLAPRAEGVDWTPGLQLADKLFNTQYGKGYVSPDAYKEKLLALKNQLQAQKKSLTDEQLNMLKNSMGGGALGQLKTLAQMQYQQRYNPAGAMQQLAEFRAAQGARDKVLQRLATNKDLGARLNAYQTLDNAMSNMAAGKIRTPQQLQDFQDAIIAGLGMARGQSGVNERAERQFNTMDLKGARLKQFLTSSPQDVLKNKELIGHLQDLARQEQVNVKRQYEKRLAAVGGSGYKRLFEKYPEIQADINDALSAYAGQFESPQIPDITKLKKGQQVHVGPAPKPFAPIPEQPSQGPKVGDVEEGHRFLGGDPADAKNWEQVK